jgi:raffinose/stachyose/melibiose transport system permease protein
VVLGLLVASLIRRVATGALGTVSRTVLFLPQVIPLVAAGIVWSWLLSKSGLINQVLDAMGLGGITRAWLADFALALPAVGVIGAWVLLGLCTILLATGMSKIDQSLYESARIDGASSWQEFRAITVPSLRYEIGVCVTVTVIASLAAFDIVYISTGGGPGATTAVPGLEIYRIAFYGRRVGVASALAVLLIVLVLITVLPIQRLTREEKA